MQPEMDPAEALALAKNARERMAARAEAPSWYAPLYGIGCGGLVAGGGATPPYGILLVAVSTAFVGALYVKWQSQSGMSVSGLRKGRTRTIALLLGLALVALMLGGLALREGLGLAWGPFACGAAAALVAMVASGAWHRAWQAELGGEVE